MIVFCVPSHRYLLPAELDRSTQPAVGACRLGRFPDGELTLELDGPVAGEHCVVLGSLAPPDEQSSRPSCSPTRSAAPARPT